MLHAYTSHGRYCVHYLAELVLDKVVHCLPHGRPAHTTDNHVIYTRPVKGCKKGVL